MKISEAVKSAQLALAESTPEGLEKVRKFIATVHPAEDQREETLRVPSTNPEILQVEVIREDGSPLGDDGLGSHCYRLIEVACPSKNPNHRESTDLGAFSKEELEAAVNALAMRSLGKQKKAKAKETDGPSLS
jgi:hypothetical protein